MHALPPSAQVIFSRYTHIGLLRLLTNSTVIGEQVLTLQKAWSVYDKWLEDYRVEFYPEPPDIDATFRRVTNPPSSPARLQTGRRLLLAGLCCTASRCPRDV